MFERLNRLVMKANVNLLIVEDSMTQAIKLQASLELNNYRTRLAQNGVEALAKIKEEKPTLILTDVVMPEMDGFDFCKQVKGNPETQDIPIIMLTALSDPQDVVRGLEVGADNFLIKPCSDDALFTRIDYILTNLEIRNNSPIDMGLEIYFNGKHHTINSQRLQILDMLFSAFDNVYQQKNDLNRYAEEAQVANVRIELLEKENNRLQSELNALKKQL
jgi:two-component system, OmpR family, response regulator VanR